MRVAHPARMPLAQRPTWLVAACGLHAFAAFGAHANLANAADPAVSGRGEITKLVARADHLFAIRGRSFLTIDGDGQTLEPCAIFAALPPERTARTRLGALDADEALAAAGLPDDDDGTPEAEDALEDEGLEPTRRITRTTDVPIALRDLATGAASQGIWMATSSGLYLGNETGCTRADLPARDLLLVAVAGGTVAAASEDLLWRLDRGRSSFVVAAGLGLRPRALAVTQEGRVLVADDDGILEVAPEGTATRILDRATDVVAVCDGVALALASDGVYTWSAAGSPARVSDRPPVRTLACGRLPDARFIAAGVGVWTSVDGASWIERTGAIGHSVSAVVATDRLWMALDDTIVALDDDSTFLPASRNPTPIAGTTLPVKRIAPSWLPWPRVTVVFAAQETPVRTGWSLALLLAFPLERAETRGRVGSALASDLVRRDMALVAELASLETRVPDAETEALTRTVGQERDALR